MQVFGVPMQLSGELSVGTPVNESAAIELIIRGNNIHRVSIMNINSIVAHRNFVIGYMHMKFKDLIFLI